MRDEGRVVEAEALIREGVARQPESISLARLLATLLGWQGKYADAIEAAHDLIWDLRIDENFRSSYASWLVNLGQEPAADKAMLAQRWTEFNENEKAILDERRLAKEHSAPGSAPIPIDEPYVRSLFDCYSEMFDEHLTQLQYSAPEYIKRLIDRVMPNRGELDIVDLGCGTGMCGQMLKPLARHLTGVDLSPRMIMRAKRKKLYDRLDVGDMVEVMRKLPPPYDLLVSADVFIYIGTLEEVFAEAANILRAKGFLIATVERAGDKDGDYTLQASRRYSHSLDYIRRTAQGAGLELVRSEPFYMRTESTGNIEGICFALRKKG